jgi:class 3 adenylate cyclase
MACAGIKACETSVHPSILQVEKTRRIINAAFDMMNQAEISNMKIKIGVNTGRVIAGVIGYHKPQFSLIGDTVNTTSRVCSTGEDGFLTISNEAYQKVKGSELFFDPRKVEVKYIKKIPFLMRNLLKGQRKRTHHDVSMHETTLCQKKHFFTWNDQQSHQYPKTK